MQTAIRLNGTLDEAAETELKGVLAAAGSASARLPFQGGATTVRMEQISIAHLQRLGLDVDVRMIDGGMIDRGMIDRGQRLRHTLYLRGAAPIAYIRASANALASPSTQDSYILQDRLEIREARAFLAGVCAQRFRLRRPETAHERVALAHRRARVEEGLKDLALGRIDATEMARRIGCSDILVSDVDIAAAARIPYQDRVNAGVKPDKALALLHIFARPDTLSPWLRA